MPLIPSSTNEAPLVSIICPVFNEQDGILLFFSRLKDVVQPLEGRSRCKLIFTNNGSTDPQDWPHSTDSEKHPRVHPRVRID
jgi:hypothetical protein